MVMFLKKEDYEDLWRKLGAKGGLSPLAKVSKVISIAESFLRFFMITQIRRIWILIKLYFWKIKLILGGMIWCVCGWIQMYIFVCFQNDIKDKNSDAADF